MAEIDKGVFRPDPFAQFIPGDELTGAFEKGGENLEGLAGELDADPGFAEFADAQVHFKGTESKT